MYEQQLLELRQGVWINRRYLEEAGLTNKLKIIVQQGEIRILDATPNESETIGTEEGWEAFLSIEAEASPGKLSDASTNHDRYLYGTN